MRLEDESSRRWFSEAQRFVSADMEPSLLPPKEIGKVSRPLGGSVVPCERAWNKESGVGRFGRRSCGEPREVPARKCLPLRIYSDTMGHPLFRERRICSKMKDACSSGIPSAEGVMAS